MIQDCVGGFGFDRSRRLLRSAEFQLLFGKGRRIRRPALTVVYRAKTSGRPRLGLTIPKRAVRRAVARNRIKRQIREGFRLNQHAMGTCDLLFWARPGLAALPRVELHELLSDVWRELEERCAES